MFFQKILAKNVVFTFLLGINQKENSYGTFVFCINPMPSKSLVLKLLGCLISIMLLSLLTSEKQWIYHHPEISENSSFYLTLFVILMVSFFTP